jgi:hypothetical protein
MHRLTLAFERLHGSLTAKRAQLLNWDEVEGRSIIFLGAPAQNVPAGEVQIDGMHFERLGEANALVNERPRAGEQAVYRTYGPPYTSDYAIIAYTASPNRAYPALVLAGTNTFGTQAAADFVTRDSTVGQLLDQLGVRNGEAVPHFVAMIEVKPPAAAAQTHSRNALASASVKIGRFARAKFQPL